MNDNFDLRKFLVESKAIENMNPIFRKLNENKENTTVEPINENTLRAKIREMVLAELGGGKDYDLYETKNINLEEAKFGTKTTLGNLKDNVLFYFLKDGDEFDAKVYMTTGKTDGDMVEVKSLNGDIIKSNQNSEVVVLHYQNNKDRYKTSPLDEAKKKEEDTEDIPTDETEEDINLELNPEPATPEDELSMAAAGATGDSKEMIDHLMKALDNAKTSGNEKLVTQVLNTLKFAIDQSIVD